MCSEEWECSDLRGYKWQRLVSSGLRPSQNTPAHPTEASFCRFEVFPSCEQTWNWGDLWCSYCICAPICRSNGSVHFLNTYDYSAILYLLDLSILLTLASIGCIGMDNLDFHFKCGLFHSGVLTSCLDVPQHVVTNGVRWPNVYGEECDLLLPKVYYHNKKAPLLTKIAQCVLSHPPLSTRFSITKVSLVQCFVILCPASQSHNIKSAKPPCFHQLYRLWNPQSL